MDRTIAIAPVRKSLVVQAPQKRAFDVFTAKIDRWWPKTHHVGSAPVRLSAIEPFKGGRWYTTHEDGSEAVTGHVLVWEPPARVVFSWEINSQWKPDSTVASEVEVRFLAESERVTRVELEHRNFEVLGREGGEKMRSDVSGGWPTILELFKQVAEEVE
ncbi:MAG: SRPBCC family protein [Alphaproteobacteria bacterium]|nr:SRPBCC family protein [Alphaproteobacteria bacterium]